MDLVEDLVDSSVAGVAAASTSRSKSGSSLSLDSQGRVSSFELSDRSSEFADPSSDSSRDSPSSLQSSELPPEPLFLLLVASDLDVESVSQNGLLHLNGFDLSESSDVVASALGDLLYKSPFLFLDLLLLGLQLSDLSLDLAASSGVSASALLDLLVESPELSLDSLLSSSHDSLPLDAESLLLSSLDSDLLLELLDFLDVSLRLLLLGLDLLLESLDVLASLDSLDAELGDDFLSLDDLLLVPDLLLKGNFEVAVSISLDAVSELSFVLLEKLKTSHQGSVGRDLGLGTLLLGSGGLGYDDARESKEGNEDCEFH